MKPTAIVVHHSASLFGDAAIIRGWHTSPPNKWSDIGYHAVIMNGYRMSGKFNPALDGKIEPGRPENKIGAHCAADGMNTKALGVCLIGDSSKRAFTSRQIDALIHYLSVKCKQYNIPVSAITQHSNHEPGKPWCAGFGKVKGLPTIAQIRQRVSEKLR